MFDLAPDWVYEVLSRSTPMLHATDKRDIHGDQGARHLWFIDPEARLPEAFALDGGPRRLLASLVASDPSVSSHLDAVELPLGALWVDRPRMKKGPPAGGPLAISALPLTGARRAPPRGAA